MFPKTLALVDDDAEFSEFLSQYLQARGVAVRVFGDSSDLLVDPQAYEFEFYVLDLTLPGVDGVELLRILRRRTNAGVLVVSGRLAPDVFESVVNAGADMYLAKPVRFEQVALAVKAVQRRAVTAREQVNSWKLDRRTSELVAPDGARIALSETDMAVMECFAQARGGSVSREALRERLGYADGEQPDNVLHATIYRLRRRIERATPTVVPLQSQSRVGYVFRATLSVA
ncbi:response regulator transcription factor [Rhizobacter sp. OV335]|uniref:response regulator transcription factor n=1 Tax=Rhizobacter sp. OV335 TaxID=1500264 RepID=UPI00091C49EE|nr:response regulator transcription factor [Rhizobacter sp. OV335]SHN28782.1 two-component system, OmpR family, response regulator TctD [Rhizobacter sp. OV335]